MNIGAVNNSGSPKSASAEAAEQVQKLKQQKQILNQELKRVQTAEKGTAAQQAAVEKQVKKLKEQIQNIDDQIKTAENKPAQQVSQEIQGAEKATAARGEQTENREAATPSKEAVGERRKFDEFVSESGQPAEQQDNTYLVKNEEGRKVVQFHPKKEDRVQESME